MPETKDEKQVQQQPPQPAAAGGASKPELFRVLSRVCVALMALGWAGTATFLLTGLSFMGSESVPLGRLHVRPGALGVGVLLGAAVAFGLLKKLGDKMVWSRPGLGRAVRLSAFGGIAALTAFGAYALYMAPTIHSLWWADVVGPAMIFGKALTLKPILVPAVAVFLSVMSGVFLLLNQEKWADFLIETEGEIKKVSWPARKEFMGSAMIVVLVVAIVSMFLHYVDKGLSQLMQYWGVGF
jgi:preprotein translocase SecE subunit